MDSEHMPPDPELCAMFFGPVSRAAFKKLLSSRIQVPKSAFKKGSKHPALTRAIDSIFWLSKALSDPNFPQGNKKIVKEEVQDVEVRKVIAAGLQADVTPRTKGRALVSIPQAFADMDLERDMPAGTDVLQLIFQSMLSSNVEILEDVTGMTALLVLGAAGEPKEVTARRLAIRRRLIDMGAVGVLIKLIKIEHNDEDEIAMECAYALSGFFIRVPGEGSALEKHALGPGLIPRLIELTTSPHCQGEVQKMALQCMAAIVGLSRATALALKKAGAERVAQRVLDTGMGYEPQFRPRTLHNATQLLRNIQMNIDPSDEPSDEEGDDYVAGMSEADAAAASRGLSDLLAHLLDSGPESMDLLGEIAAAAFGAPGACRRTRAEVLTLLQGLKRKELQQLVWSSAFADLLMKASMDEKEALAEGGTLKAIARMLHNKDPQKRALTLRAVSHFSNAPNLVPRFWELGIFKEAMDALLAVDPETIQSDADTWTASACMKIVSNMLTPAGAQAKIKRDTKSISCDGLSYSAVNRKALKAMIRAGVFAQAVRVFTKFVKISGLEASYGQEHTLRLLQNSCLLDRSVEDILGAEQGLAAPLAALVRDTETPFAMRAVGVIGMLARCDPFWRGLAVESGLLGLFSRKARANIALEAAFPQNGYLWESTLRATCDAAQSSATKPCGATRLARCACACERALPASRKKLV